MRIFLSPCRASPFLAWGDFFACWRFARSTIPEEKWGTTRSLPSVTRTLDNSNCCRIILTLLRWFKQVKRTVSFDVTKGFNAIQQSAAMYNSHIFNVRNTTINLTKGCLENYVLENEDLRPRKRRPRKR